jgi:Ca2+-binding EF-hand superfamily protein
MGVGLDQRNINEWIEDIWESFDRDGNGSIDKYEIKNFVDQTFKTAGIRLNY